MARPRLVLPLLVRFIHGGSAVTSLAAAIILQAAVLSTGQTYAQAHKTTQETGRPLLVMVGADWCPACQQMKSSLIPQLRRRGILKKVSFTIIDTDEQEELADQIMSGGTIPQLIIYTKTDKGWIRRQLTGGQSVGGVEQFIDRAVKSNAASTLRR
jgi:thioredoxin-like negative regulator of GroEL